MEIHFFDGRLYTIYLTQYGFIASSNIFDIVLNVQMAMYYAQHTHQELIMVQLDLERGYCHVNWSFVYGLMHTMGFGLRMSRLIFLLGQVSRLMFLLRQDIVSRIIFNGGITSNISLTRSVSR